MCIVASYLSEQREPGFISRRTSSVPGELEVQVESVEVSLTHEADAGPDEPFPRRSWLQHGRHVGRAHVPATNGQRRRQVRILHLQVVKPLVPVACCMVIC